MRFAPQAKEEEVLGEIEVSLESKTAVFRDQVEAKQKELQPWTRQLNELQSAYDLTKSELDIVANRAKQVRHCCRTALRHAPLSAGNALI